MWAKLARLIPFRDHINIEARAVAAHKSEPTGYGLTPKGMLQIYMHQEILIRSFSKTLNS